MRTDGALKLRLLLGNCGLDLHKMWFHNSCHFFKDWHNDTVPELAISLSV